MAHHRFLCGVAILALCAAAAPAWADNYDISGYADFRLVHPSDSDSYLVGGLGKTRWGQEDGAAAQAELGALVLRASAVPVPSIRAVIELRYDTQQKTALDILDAYVRWRPVSISRWRWSVKGGAFFPPISLENGDIGWSSYWTLTPSAINSWVGNELRTIGGESTLEWRGDVDHIAASAAVFAWNQAAGVDMAGAGWNFDDHPTGLLDHLRLPDALAEARLAPGQSYNALYADEFRQIDGNPGWYASAAWERPDYGRLTALYYDNNANPAAHDSEFAWHTRFWSVGATTQIGQILLIAQGMTGSTMIRPAANLTFRTDFEALFLLAGWQRGNWRYAVRADQFRTDGALTTLGEHGYAETAAITWKARRWLRLTSEILHIDSWRSQRLADDDTAPCADETQAQISARFQF